MDDFEVLAGEVGFDRDGTHVHKRAFELVNAVHQDRVFVDLLFLDLDKTLADGLDIADARVDVLHGGQEAERGGRLPVVLARGGDEDARVSNFRVISGDRGVTSPGRRWPASG